MHLMLQQPKPKDYLIGTGRSHSVADFVTQVVSELRRIVGDKRFEGPLEDFVEVDARLVRTNEIHDLCGDATLARKNLGWTPEVDFPGLVRMMVESDLGRIANQVEERVAV
jgi:GDPmannose 4,6-dehydratase